MRYLAVLLILSLILSGCAFNDSENDSAVEKTLPEPTEEARNQFLGEIAYTRSVPMTFYYAMADGTSYMAVSRTLRIPSTTDVIAVAINEFLTSATNNSRIYTYSTDIALLYSELACGIATVNLSIDARNVQSEMELLALVTSLGNTLLSISGIDAVNILIGNESEGICYLPFGVQTSIIPSLTAAYAQLQAERDYFIGAGSMSLKRQVALYLPHQSGKKLLPTLRELTFDDDSFAERILSTLSENDTTLSRGLSALENVSEIITTENGEHILELKFGKAFASEWTKTGLPLWQFIGAVTLTLTSFMPELAAVRMLFDGEALTVCDIDSTVVIFEEGLIRRHHFADCIGNEVTLYLPCTEGLRAVRYADSVRAFVSEKRILEALFETASKDVNTVLPDTVTAADVLGVQVTAGLAKVNLSGNFYCAVQSMSLEQEQAIVYALVNTLCESEDIRVVRFYFEGVAADTLAGNIYLKSPLMPNPGIVVQEGASDETENTGE